MTEAQHRAFRFICTYIEMRGRSPTFQEIADGIGLKTRSAVHRIVDILVSEDLISRALGRPCSIRLTAKAMCEDTSLIALPLALRMRLQDRAIAAGVSPSQLAHRFIREGLDGRAG
ncbi:hypothetical protein ABLE91_05675 [Aquabacter sp. CN5-332]|uniref:LexA family protein n=1 Tax=Aquabacter sp. CN5-332 TaxID=3156608 RepID=UPI0032B50C15